MSYTNRRGFLLMVAAAVAAVATTETARAADILKSRRKKGVYTRSRPPAGREPRYKTYCRRNASACRGSYADNKHKFLMDRHKQRRLKDRHVKKPPARAEHP